MVLTRDNKAQPCHLDECYNIFLPAYLMTGGAEVAEEEKMALAWSKAVARDLKALGAPALVLQIGEAKRQEPNYTWQAIISSDAQGLQDNAELGGLYAIDASQYYAAYDTINPEEDYMGVLDLAVAMYALDAENGMHDIARIVLRLAAMHYYEQIATCFPTWRTDYRDSLRRAEVRKIDVARVTFE